MSLRETLGGKVEEALNKIVDEKLKGLSLDKIKAELHEQLDQIIDKHLAGVIDGLGDKLKKDVIDLIDGQDDIVQIYLGLNLWGPFFVEKII